MNKTIEGYTLGRVIWSRVSKHWTSKFDLGYPHVRTVGLGFTHIRVQHPILEPVLQSYVWVSRVKC